MSWFRPKPPLVQRIEVLELGPDDVVILQTEGVLSPEAVERLRLDAVKVFGLARRIAVLTNGMDVKVLRDAEPTPIPDREPAYEPGRRRKP